MTQNIKTKKILSFLVIGAWVALLTACNTSPAATTPALTHTAIHTPANFLGLTPGPGSFSGYYINSFEASAFIPCSPDDNMAQREVWWLTSSPNSGFWDVAATVVPSLPTQTTIGWKAFVRFEGSLSELGKYGHLGQYSREITVTHMLEMVAPLKDKDTMCY